MRPRTKKKINKVITYLLAAGIMIATLAPFVWLIISSLSTRADLTKTPLRLFHTAAPTLANYKALILGTSNSTTDAAAQFMNAMKNSTIVALSVTIIALAVGLFASYAFSRYRFKGRNVMLNATIYTQMIPPIAIIIPMYILLLNLNMLDKRVSLVIIYLTFALPFLIWIMKGYIDGVPTEMEEAALIDGCGRLGAFFRVVLPVISTGLAATVIFAFIISWNEFFYALNLTSTVASKTLPVLITEFSSKYGSNFILSSTAGVLASLPPVLISLIFQRFIISGLTSGAVKG